jgi:hypothetical protein
MNYYSNQEVEQVVEEPDRQPVPASAHVALNSPRAGKPRDRKLLIKAAVGGGAVFLFVCLAQVVQLPSWMLFTVAVTLIGVFVYVSIKEGNNVRRH